MCLLKAVQQERGPRKNKGRRRQNGYSSLSQGTNSTAAISCHSYSETISVKECEGRETMNTEYEYSNTHHQSVSEEMSQQQRNDETCSRPSPSSGSHFNTVAGSVTVADVTSRFSAFSKVVRDSKDNRISTKNVLGKQY